LLGERLACLPIAEISKLGIWSCALPGDLIKLTVTQTIFFLDRQFLLVFSPEFSLLTYRLSYAQKMRLQRLFTVLTSTTVLLTHAVAIPQPNELAQTEQHEDEFRDTKYFHEPGGDDLLGHYDQRYFKGVVSYDERTDTLHHMIRAYLNTFRELGIETWIAHGTLLGWWWNGKVGLVRDYKYSPESA